MKKISLCGDDCAKCPRFNAKTDGELRAAAELWHKLGWRDRVVEPDEMRCEGCFPGKDCSYGINGCVRSRGAGTCGRCAEFECGKIRTMLEKMRRDAEKCREICADDEYKVLEEAFFRKSENLNGVVMRVNAALAASGLNFSVKPILIGGSAMEYYGIRKSGRDIDLVITDADYQALAAKYPEKRKDLYGDLGLVIGEFEIWRSIAHLDYGFFSKDAVEEERFFAVSDDRLLWTRVCAMDVEKYRNDLVLMRDYYYKTYTNPEFHAEAAKHEASYAKLNGAVFGGAYQD